MIETPQVIQCSVGMRWGDMDAYGHVNNVEILRILEEARIHAFGPPGGTGGPGREPVVALFNNVPAGTQALVAEHRVKYLSPLTYRNIPADIAVWISALKGASLTIAYVIRDPVTAQTCAKAETTLAFVDGDTGRLLRIAPEQKALMLPYLGASVF
ncbi:thioesterase family protein [Arthrobacter sp. zg-Y820]|uniref:acyl-CoA thioesterase n=1 Tax=unclassified Arthrobacter TaxID=235627 RepID=UPI001E50914E|nr:MULTISPECIES: thioesterase family protein [unclassified Arthrobacter]MCC9195429.1 acyl-CoA thioesterase [Arthrobacter sp. zg-Y820]MDK1278288.1 thioesterase family protein [Arthrobacter sp. zg.Y820]MDK1361229.1 thioesterase family protein [Arthrobacter sp. zg-Y1219]WIB10167.1 thioesterase family protein [Arthrobacter sp. zg-Y820]